MLQRKNVDGALVTGDSQPVRVLPLGESDAVDTCRICPSAQFLHSKDIMNGTTLSHSSSTVNP